VPGSSGRLVRIGTRGSPLALWQAGRVAELITTTASLPVEVVPIRTAGDSDRRRALWEFPSPGVFTSALEEALASGAVDVAVHSLKDLPTAGRDGLVVAAVLKRGDPRDALVGPGPLSSLMPGAVVATSSLRRRVQLAALRPDLSFALLRGNMETRLARAQRGQAVVVALAALERLGRASEAAQTFEADELTPCAGQGAIAVQARSSDEWLLEVLGGLEDRAARIETDTERAVVALLGAGCHGALGVLARLDAGDWRLEVVAACPARDGSLVRVKVEGHPDPASMAARVADELKSRGVAPGERKDKGPTRERLEAEGGA
jgi:hydroxymethylbilane synthase